MTTDTQAIYTAAKNTPDRIIVDLNIAADVLADMGQFETGQSIMREAADLIRDQSAEIVRMRTKGYGGTDTQAAVAAALMQAAEAVDQFFDTISFDDEWLLEDLQAAILALITPDAMAALEAERAKARKVKPLVWERDRVNGEEIARSMVGTYVVTKHSWGRATDRNATQSDNPKAAAQADYEARILAALDKP